jgi:hypothetical protein
MNNANKTLFIMKYGGNVPANTKEKQVQQETLVLPYNGTSGWSGSNTSQERALNNDSSGQTKSNQTRTLLYLDTAGADGLTWKELSDLTDWHHGTASGVLSVLHKERIIYRLIDTRNRCKVYVHPDHLNGRDHETHGRKRKECPNCGHAL